MELLTDARQALHQVVEPDQPNVAVVRPNLALILHLQNEDDAGTVSEGGTIKFFPPTCRNKFMCGGTGEKRGEKIRKWGRKRIRRVAMDYVPTCAWMILQCPRTARFHSTASRSGSFARMIGSTSFRSNSTLGSIDSCKFNSIDIV